jgi:hypothetical protein
LDDDIHISVEVSEKIHELFDGKAILELEDADSRQATERGFRSIRD